MHESKGKLNNIFMSILNMVSNFSGVPLAFAYIIMFGNVGVMTMIGSNYGIEFLANFPLYSIFGLLLIYVYFQIPLSTLLLIPAFDAIRKEWKESNALLGGTNFTFWTKIGVPILMPSILSTFSVLFANALAAYCLLYTSKIKNYLNEKETEWKEAGAIPISDAVALFNLIDQLAGGSRFWSEATELRVEDALAELQEIICSLEEI